MKKIYLYVSDVTYDIYNYISVRLVAYCRLINPMSYLFISIKSCQERTRENLSFHFENDGPWKKERSSTMFIKDDIGLTDGSSNYRIPTKIIRRIWMFGQFPNVR
jgi:hypothetical protein